VTVQTLRLSHEGQIPVLTTAWYHKADPTFAGGLTLVRRHLWRVRYLVNFAADLEFLQFPRVARERLLSALPLAA